MQKRSWLIAVLILCLGVAIRCVHLFLIDPIHEPFRLGGLFVAIAEEIIVRNFQLPINIPFYSAGGIPFAYPPLGFYAEAVLLKIFPGQDFAVANLLPPAVSILALGLAARFSYRWAGGWNLRSLSALASYALLPGAFYNQIEAAGLAEAFGSLALIVCFELLIAFQQKDDFASALYAGLGLALCVVSSPGSALGVAFISVILAFDTLVTVRWSQKARPYWRLFNVGITGLAVSAPYWLSVALHHGVQIFLSPLEMQYQSGAVAASWLTRLRDTWFTYSALQQDGVYFWSTAILLGTIWLVWQRKIFLPMAFLVLISIPRENAWVTAFPAALLIGHGVADVLAPTVKSLSVFTLSARIRTLWAIFSLIVVSVTVQAFELVNLQVQNENWKLGPAQVETLKRAREIIPAAAPVIILGNGGLREWSPYLLQREVLNTEFGLEWQPEEYRQIVLANQLLENAKNWQEVGIAVRSLTGQEQVYVILDTQSFWTGLDEAENDPLLIKIESPALQVGVLVLP